MWLPRCIFYKEHRRLETARTAIFVSFEQEWGLNQLVECESLRWKVVSIDKSRFDWRQESGQSVCWSNLFLKIFSVAVDKRTKNNLYMQWVSAVSARCYHHLLFYRNLWFDRTDQWFRSNELTLDWMNGKRLSIKTTFDRTDLIAMRVSSIYMYEYKDLFVYP